MVKNKKVSGYGQGGVDVVMSVDQVAKEAAAISAAAPKSKELEKLSKNEPLLSTFRDFVRSRSHFDRASLALRARFARASRIAQREKYRCAK